MVRGHGTHEDGIGAAADTRQFRGIRGIGLNGSHIPPRVRTDASARKNDIMSFFAKKSGGLASDRACTDNDMETHGNLSSKLYGEA